MFNLVELQQQKAHKILSRKEILDRAEKAEGGARPMTEEECKLFDKLTEDIGKLGEQIASVEAHNRRKAESDQLIKDMEKPAQRISTPDVPARTPQTPAAHFTVPATARRTGVLKAFKPKNGETQEDCDRRAYRAGLWARAMIFRSDWAMQKCMDMGIGVDLRNAMGTTSNPDGGFLVPDELSQAIIVLREEYGVARRYARVWPMGSDTLDIPRRATGVTISALGENPAAAYSQTTPTFSMVKLVAKKFGGLSLYSSEIAEDAVIDTADWIASEYAYGFANFEDTAFFNGDGTNTYQGIQGIAKILIASSSLKGAVSAASTHDTMAEIDHTDLTTLMGTLPQYALANAKFYCSSVFNSVVFGRLLATAGGNNVMTLQGSTGNSYLGYPIVISQVLETSTGTINGTVYCLFGDLSKSSALGDRRSIRIFPSAHRYMDTDQIAILGTERIDIVHNDYGDTSTAGPIVALNGKT